jgi:hypothetical protein
MECQPLSKHSVGRKWGGGEGGEGDKLKISFRSKVPKCKDYCIFYSISYGLQMWPFEEDMNKPKNQEECRYCRSKVVSVSV